MPEAPSPTVRKRGRPRKSGIEVGIFDGIAGAPTIARNGKRVAVETAEVDVAVHEKGQTKLPKAGDVLKVKHAKSGAQARVHVGDCRDILAELDEAKRGEIDLIFADPPFNWKRGYDQWNDSMGESEYVTFTFDWIDACIRALRPGGSMWINIPDTWAAEIVCYMKRRLERKPPALMAMQNWCVWHYRFGQNATERFINSKVHALYFIKGGAAHTWRPEDVLEMSDRAAIYEDPRTLEKKDGMPARMRVPLDVWYGKFWGRVQGNSKERRHYHDNQLPEVYLERVISACSKPNDLVLDPFLGSGTTGVVAHALGRRFIGCEFSPENARGALDRIQRGPVREMGANKGASTAIFGHRRKSGKSSAAFSGESEQ